MEITITKHAFKRAYQRLGINKKVTQGLAEDAYQYGVDFKYLPSEFNDYLTNIWNKQKKMAKLYGKNVYIFGENNVLVTIYHLPLYLRKNIKNNV